jgi:hypothetical protein
MIEQPDSAMGNLVAQVAAQLQNQKARELFEALLSVQERGGGTAVKKLVNSILDEEKRLRDDAEETNER